jgi:hypothetical protein
LKLFLALAFFICYDVYDEEIKVIISSANGEIEIIKFKDYRRKNIMNKLNGNPYGPSRSEILERKNQELEVKEILKEILNKID